MKKSILSAACSFLLAASLAMTGCSSSGKSNEDDSLQRVLDNGKLVMGLDATFKPMGYTDENDNIVGFDIDVASEVCSRMGVELELCGVNWDTKEVELDAGTVDCIWNGLSISEKRKEIMLMSDPYMENRMVFAVMSDSDIKTPSDLNGKTVSVQVGSTAEAILMESDIRSDITINGLSTNVEALNQLEMGMCDAVFLDEVVVSYEIKNEEKNFRILEEGLASEEYAVGFRKGEQKLCDKVEEVLKEMKKDGKLAEISTKWFGSDITCVK